MSRKGQGAPVRKLSSAPARARRRDVEKRNFRAVGEGVIQRALLPLAVDAEASRAVAAAMAVAARAVAAPLARLLAQACRYVGEVVVF